MKRIIITALTASLLALPITGAEAKDRSISGSFTAQATPMPVGWPAPGGGCMSGPEGLHRVTKMLTAPFSGWLYARADFAGDWDLGVFDTEGSALASSEHQFATDEPAEVVDLYVRRGQEVGISACNAASAGAAEVTYVLTEGPAWSEPAGRTLRTHTEQLTYRTPSIGVDGGVCYVGYQIGCDGTASIAATDRWVYVKVDDALTELTQRPGQMVSAEIYQYVGNTYLGGERFCTSIEDPVRLKPGVDFVGVTILQGACESGEPAVATQGEVTVIFSNQRV